MGWRMQKTWEVGLSYGIIKDIDIDHSEDELLKYISCENTVITTKRLNRKNENGWTPSESVRIGFKGSYLPTHVYLLNLRIKVHPYELPVTQCSRILDVGDMVIP